MFKAAGFYGATVEALTLSIEQKCATEKHIAHAGLSHAINVHVLDYREMPESFHHAFDAVVSIDVMEHSEFLFFEILLVDSHAGNFSRDGIHVRMVSKDGLGHET